MTRPHDLKALTEDLTFLADHRHDLVPLRNQLTRQDYEPLNTNRKQWTA